MNKKPRLAIIGIGQYYHKLESAINKYFDPVLKADLAEMQVEGGNLKSIVLRSRPDAAMILTPNHAHAKQILELADLHIPILVEKPLVTTEKDLQFVIDSLKINPLLYCSDFYLDVRAAPLLAWLRRPYPKCLEKWIMVEMDKDGAWHQGPSMIGAIQNVESVLLEGEGQARGFEEREWLWDPLHGGVLWDLAYHFVVLWYGLFKESLRVVSCDSRTTENVPGRPVAETYATLELRSSSGIPFLIRVGKYQEHGNQRWFRMDASHGQASMIFQNPNILQVKAQSREGVALLTGNYYAHVVEAFCEYVNSEPSQPHGIEHAAAATHIIAAVKQLRQKTYSYQD